MPPLLSLLISFEASLLVYDASLLEGIDREVVLDAARGSTSISDATGVAVLARNGFVPVGGVVLGLLGGGLGVLDSFGSGGHLFATFAGTEVEPATFSLNCSILFPLPSPREFTLLLLLLLDSLLRSGLDNLGPDLS